MPHLTFDTSLTPVYSSAAVTQLSIWQFSHSPQISQILTFAEKNGKKMVNSYKKVTQIIIIFLCLSTVHVNDTTDSSEPEGETLLKGKRYNPWKKAFKTVLQYFL